MLSSYVVQYLPLLYFSLSPAETFADGLWAKSLTSALKVLFARVMSLALNVNVQFLVLTASLVDWLSKV